VAQQSGLPSVPPAARAQVQPQYIVVLDAAHGGTDPGARLSDKLLEKNVALALVLRLRSALAAQGIQVVTTRDSDATVPLQARAETANHALAEACITLHATGTGNGVHLFTSSLAPAPRVQFLPWRTAQAAYVTQGLRLSSEINAALAHVAVPVILGRTSLQPMDSFACPAVAVEVANAGNVPLTDDAYQKKIVDALTSALTQWKNDWRPQP
jgi:N-acetylmuramoyl-L-alanine amidase